MEETPAKPRRIVLLGTESAYTRAAAHALVAEGLTPVAVLRTTAGPRPAPSLASRALRLVGETGPGWPEDLLVQDVDDANEAAVKSLLARLAPDVVIAACVPRRLSGAWLDQPPLGCWNIHPSLLPRYRGPVPVFWQLREGERETGVTVHRMDAGFDTGPILGRSRIALPPGARADELDTVLASAGAALAARLLGDPPRAVAQAEGEATHQGWPEDTDRVVPVEWGARRAFDFIRGAASFAPFGVRSGQAVLAVADALSWSPALPTAPRKKVPWSVERRTATVRFKDGLVQVRLA